MFIFDRSLKNLFRLTLAIVVFTIAVFTIFTLFFEKKHLETEVLSSLLRSVEEQQQLIERNIDKVGQLSLGPELEEALNFYVADNFEKLQRTYIIDSDGFLLWGTNNAHAENFLPSMLLSIASERDQKALSYKNYLNDNVFGAYSWINNDRWLIINEVNKAEVLASFYQKAIILLIISLILILLFSHFHYKIYNQINKPIETLVSSVASLNKGKSDIYFNKGIIANIPTEFQLLFNKFNELSNSVKKNENDINKMERSFLSLVSSSNHAIILADKNMKVLLWNKGAESIFQFKQEEIEGKSFLSIIPEQFKDQHQCAFINPKLNQEKLIVGSTLELAGLKKDGTEFPIELSVASWEFNNETFFYGIIRDISRRKDAEKVIFSRNTRFQSAFENSGVGIALATQEGNFVYFNPAFKELLKFNESELLKMKFSEITYEDDLHKDKLLFEKLITKKIDKYQVTKRYLRKDKSVIWVCLTISNVELPSNAEKYIIVMTEDITSKKNTEEALSRSEEYLSHIVETIPSGVIIIDVSGTITFANSMASEILNLNRRKLLDGKFNVFNLEVRNISGELFNNNNLCLDIIIEKRKQVKNLELVIKRVDGMLAPISVNATPLIEEEKVTGILVSIVDISQRVKMEQNLRRANENLAELSMTDALTGIGNRRHFNAVFDREWSRHLRNKMWLSIIIVDIDHFKEFNDTYGHQQGDECLKLVATSLETSIRRPCDFVSRYGGEEFIVVLPETTIEGALHVGERIRKEIEKLNIPHQSSKTASVVTVSGGVAATSFSNGYSLAFQKRFIEDADKALYQAKMLGRNRVEAILKG